LEKNQGKGAAFRKGIDSAKGKYIIQIDADLQFQPEEIPHFIDKLQTYDIVVGSRFNQGSIEKGSVSLVNLFGNWLMSATTTVFSGIRVTDIMAGFKGFRANIAKKLNLSTSHFGYEAEIIVKAGKYDYSVFELPITYKKRTIGSSSVNPIQDGLKVSSTVIRLYFQIPGQSLGYGKFGNTIKNILGIVWVTVGIIPITYVMLITDLKPVTFRVIFGIFIYKIVIAYFLFLFIPYISRSFTSGFISSFIYTLIPLSARLFAYDQKTKLIYLTPITTLFIIGLLFSNKLYGYKEKRMNLILKVITLVTGIVIIFALFFQQRGFPLYLFQILISVYSGIIYSMFFLKIVDFEEKSDSLLSKRRIFLTLILFILIFSEIIILKVIF
jgi:glycosyltransferase involved in cell wall biosynthesis